MEMPVPRLSANLSFTLPALLLAGLALSTTACSREADRQPSSGSAASDTSTAQDWGSLANFTGIDATGPDNVVATIGKDFAVRAEGDAKTIEQLDIRVKGDRLVIGRKSNGLWNKVNSGQSATIHVTLPAIAKVALTGSGDITLDKATGPSLDLSLTGSGNIAIGTIAVGQLKSEITGSGNVTLAGTADEGDVSITGSGDVDAAKLKIGRGKASVLGSGNIDFASDGPIAIKIMGSGDVTVKGKAQCNSSRVGPGEAHCAP